MSNTTDIQEGTIVSEAMVPRTALEDVMPLMTLAQADTLYTQMRWFVENQLIADIDYGIIPGTAKPTLYKPGAEKLLNYFGLSADLIPVTKTENWDTGLFHYSYRCEVRTRAGILKAALEGSCNSYETKYRWRWVTADKVPPHMDKATLTAQQGTLAEPEFAVGKSETTGKYGKPLEYWEQFKEAMRNKTARYDTRETKNGKDMTVVIIDASVYRIPNEGIADVVNTVQQIAQKRAMLAATRVAVSASEYFTQDIEDNPDFNPKVNRPADPPPPPKEPPITQAQREEIKQLAGEIWGNAASKSMNMKTNGRKLVYLSEREARAILDELRGLKVKDAADEFNAEQGAGWAQVVTWCSDNKHFISDEGELDEDELWNTAIDGGFSSKTVDARNADEFIRCVQAQLTELEMTKTIERDADEGDRQ